MPNETGMTYAGTGVNYDAMDPFKRMAQLAGRATAQNLTRKNKYFREVESSRGESVYLIETPDMYLAFVEEGLGTKNVVADEMYKLTGKTYYDQVAQCTVAMILNDMITLGARPLSTEMHLAAGDSNWFNDQIRSQDLIRGWRQACDLAQCTWGGGETPTLKDIVSPNHVVLSGSAIGAIRPKERLIKGDIKHGDMIIFLESSGIHANGLTMARKIADKLPDGYLTKLPDGRSYGESLLDPTHLYVRFVEACLDWNIPIHYTVNITGHGWRKLMRAPQDFTYVIESLPRQRPIFDFMQKHGPIDDREAYGNLNMGAGFALFIPEIAWNDLMDMMRIRVGSFGESYCCLRAGHIERGPKKVVIKPKGLEFSAETLAVR